MRSATTLAIADSICRTLGNGQTAGGLTAMRFPAGGNLWRTQRYYPWSARRNRGMLAGLKVGLSEGGGRASEPRLRLQQLRRSTAADRGRTTSLRFTYDGLGRLTSACGRTYSDDSVRQLQAGLCDDFDFYNHGRPHQSPDYRTPAEERCVLRRRQTARCRTEPAASVWMHLVFPVWWSSDWDPP